MTQPKTAAEILALPIGPEFGQEIADIDGRQYIRPIVPEFECVWSDEDEPIMVRDADGIWWALSKYKGDGYFRRTVYAV